MRAISGQMILDFAIVANAPFPFFLLFGVVFWSPLSVLYRETVLWAGVVVDLPVSP